MMDLDGRIDALVDANRLEEAARLAEELGQWKQAQAIWERACNFGRAATAALATESFEAALRLGAVADDEATIDRALRALAAQPERLCASAEMLAMRGHHRLAGRAFATAGLHERAAAELERGGALHDAANAFVSADNLSDACRCLEVLLTKEPEAWMARVELGALLISLHRFDRAARVLQRVSRGTEARPAAVPLLTEALNRLGLESVAKKLESARSTRSTHTRGIRDAAAKATAAAAMPVLFGRYEVLSEAATTPTARVFLARDRISGRRVAVKLYAAAALRNVGRDIWRRFEVEARVLREMTHPCVVPFVEYVPSGPAVVTRWMEGGSLADLLSKQRLSPSRAASITDAVLRALGEAHRRGMLHRDVKPHNVFLDETGAARLGDFGAAHARALGATVTQGVIGTLAYMAPEQRAGHAATVASDLFGAGAVLWHALTGAAPGAAQPPRFDNALSERHREIAATMIGPLERRPSSAQEALQMLSSVTWPKIEPSGPIEPPREAPRPVEKRLRPAGPHCGRDTLLGRDVRIVQPTSPDWATALAFARADHPHLAAILSRQPGSGDLWVEDIGGSATLDGLDPMELEAAQSALRALHRAGGTHGRLNAAHVTRVAGTVVLRFPDEYEPSTPEADIMALDRLRR